MSEESYLKEGIYEFICQTDNISLLYLIHSLILEMEKEDAIQWRPLIS